jgi:hypothetical protein
MTAWSGCLTEAKPILPCRNCSVRKPADLFYYVDGSVITNFDERLRAMRGQVTCAGCGNRYEVRGPLILDLPARNLLIFVTHHGDDGRVEEGFRQFLQKMASALPEFVSERAMSTPYTFVHGYRGLLALLDAFNDVDPNPEVSPGDGGILHTTPLNGYQYGRLFFYFPSHLNVQPIISTAVSAAIDLEQIGQRGEAITFLQGLVQRIGPSHPWLPVELGRLLLADGQNKEALLMLRQAATSTHSWHGVTMSFLDATPRRRADGETQAEDVPIALASASLADITAQRHTVAGLFPAKKDTGLWDFPQTAQSTIPEQYTLENVITAYAYSLGRIDRYLMIDFNGYRPKEPTHVGWYILQEASREILQQYPDYESLFWLEFTRTRWPLAWPLTAQNAGVESSKRQILQLLEQLPREQKEPNPFALLARGYHASHSRFFLQGALALLSKG